jgi:hypothetical protein
MPLRLLKNMDLLRVCYWLFGEFYVAIHGVAMVMTLYPKRLYGIIGYTYSFCPVFASISDTGHLQ